MTEDMKITLCILSATMVLISLVKMVGVQGKTLDLFVSSKNGLWTPERRDRWVAIMRHQKHALWILYAAMVVFGVALWS